MLVYTQFYFFPGLQTLKSGCNHAVCSWTETTSCGEGWKEAGRRKEGGSSPGQGKGAATFWESSSTAILFTNFCFGRTSDKLAGKFLTPLFPGSALCQLLPPTPLSFPNEFRLILQTARAPRSGQSHPFQAACPAWRSTDTVVCILCSPAGICSPLCSPSAAHGSATSDYTRDYKESLFSGIASRATLKGSA